MAMDALREAIKRKRMALTDNPEAVIGDKEVDYLDGLSPEEKAELEDYLAESETDLMLSEDSDMDEDKAEKEDKMEAESYGRSPSVDDREGIEDEFEGEDLDLEASMEKEGESIDEDELNIEEMLMDERSIGRPTLRSKVSELIKAKRSKRI